MRARMPRPESSVSSCQDQNNEKANVKHAFVRDHVDKSMLGMSYYIHASGLGALVDGARPDSKGIACSAVHPR